MQCLVPAVFVAAAEHEVRVRLAEEIFLVQLVALELKMDGLLKTDGHYLTYKNMYIHVLYV